MVIVDLVYDCLDSLNLSDTLLHANLMILRLFPHEKWNLFNLPTIDFVLSL